MKNKVIICLMGIDGSGKSTLSKCLIEELQIQGLQVKYTWWLEGESSPFRKILRTGLRYFNKNRSGQLESVNSSRNMNKKNSFFLAVYPRLVLFDYLIFGIIKTRFARKMDVIVFDRYYYDVIFALSNEFQLPISTQKYFVSIFKRYIPDPDLLFIIDVPPETAYMRKIEDYQNLENAYFKWNLNKEIYEFVEKNTHSNIVKIDNSREIEIGKDEIIKLTSCYLRCN